MILYKDRNIAKYRNFARRRGDSSTRSEDDVIYENDVKNNTRCLSLVRGSRLRGYEVTVVKIEKSASSILSEIRGRRLTKYDGDEV